MDAAKTILMGCGALALLSVVGCMGLTSVGYYAVDKAVEEQQAREAASGSSWKSRNSGVSNTTNSSDLFSDYDSNTYIESGDEGDWGNEAQ